MVRAGERADEAGGTRLRRELARGTIELAILSVLAGGRQYGYELLTELNGTTGGVPEVKEGTLYPLLHRLEDAGHVSSSWEAEGRTPPRKYYLLTAAGQAQLDEMRTEWQRLVAGMRRLLDGEGAKR